MMEHKLTVYLFDQAVGTLYLQQGRLSFSYLPAWLKNNDARALSFSLPLQEATFDDHQCRAFFAGLLPEGRLRQLIAKQSHISHQNDFALLDLMGGECAGAVSLRPADAPLPISTAGGSEHIRWLNTRTLQQMLSELPGRPMLAGQEGVRLSLAGAQDKLPVVFDGHRIGLPLNGTPSSHILKPAIAAVDNSVINEYFCLELADAIQLAPAKALIYSIGNSQCLLVGRYDRVADVNGQLTRLHQEDFCQALGIVPEMKYQNEGGPGLTHCFDLLRRVTRPNAPQILRLFDYVIFNALVGNHDAHAKNFSLLYKTGGAPMLAPMYDVLCTTVYPDLTAKMAMKIGSKYKFSEVESRHWDEFANQAGLARAPAKKRILELAGRLPAVANELADRVAELHGGRELLREIADLIEQRCALTVKRLSPG